MYTTCTSGIQLDASTLTVTVGSFSLKRPPSSRRGRPARLSREGRYTVDLVLADPHQRTGLVDNRSRLLKGQQWAAGRLKGIETARVDDRIWPQNMLDSMTFAKMPPPGVEPG